MSLNPGLKDLDPTPKAFASRQSKPKTAMQKNPGSQSRFANRRNLLAALLCSVGAVLAVASFATPATPSVVQAFAGGGVGDGAPATSAVLSFPTGLFHT